MKKKRELLKGLFSIVEELNNAGEYIAILEISDNKNALNSSLARLSSGKEKLEKLINSIFEMREKFLNE